MSIEVSYYFMNPCSGVMEYPVERYPFETFEQFKEQFKKAQKRVKAFKACSCTPTWHIV